MAILLNLVKKNLSSMYSGTSVYGHLTSKVTSPVCTVEPWFMVTSLVWSSLLSPKLCTTAQKIVYYDHLSIKVTFAQSHG